MIYLKKMTNDEESKIERLYIEAFPAGERKPFSMLLRMRRKQKANLLVIHETKTGKVVGLAFFLKYKEDVLFDYFAVIPECRNKGYGSVVLEKIKEYYSGRRIFGEVEVPDKNADDYNNQLRRMEFYKRNDFKETGIVIDMNGCELQIMYVGEKPVSYEEYRIFIDKVFGFFGRKYARAIRLKYELNK